MVDLLVPISLDQLLIILETIFFLIYKTTSLDEEGNRNEPSPSVRLSWLRVQVHPPPLPPEQKWR
jgi:hypothetical protein